jgi:hypothetical protein
MTKTQQDKMTLNRIKIARKTLASVKKNSPIADVKEVVRALRVQMDYWQSDNNLGTDSELAEVRKRLPAL